MFYSTRNHNLRKTASEAILSGLASDGGLFLPEEIPSLPLDEKLYSSSYQELAKTILSLYLDDFTKEEISEAVDHAYDKIHFPEEIFGLKNYPGYSFLELFHGATLTFKDMALSLLPYLMSLSLKKHPGHLPIHILTATSGDTGSAVLSSFQSQPGIKVSILYPLGGVSRIQEMQMKYFTDPSQRAYALRGGNFDDCQTLVKKILKEDQGKSGYSSANSINIGRLLPQIVYYYAGYIRLVKEKVIKPGEVIDVVVPTGNFGDIFAAYLAKRMSLPLGKLVIASNKNRVLTDFFSTGIYSLKREFYKTNSPSMDILISSNLERLLYLTTGDDQLVRSYLASLAKEGEFKVSDTVFKRLREDFVPYTANEKETEDGILMCYQENGYTLDPHTAVGYECYRKYRMDQDFPRHCLLVSTASPLKFPLTIEESLGFKKSRNDLEALAHIEKACSLTLPYFLKKVLDDQTPTDPVSEEDFRKLIRPLSAFCISENATTANVGPGFDCFGIPLSLVNQFRFAPAEKEELLGFSKEDSTENNLVLRSYRYYFAKLSLPYVPLSITLEKQEIPEARGLGSSAACILAGLKAADHVAHHKCSKESLLSLAIDLEGHPDNLAPLLYEKPVVSLKKDDSGYQYVPLEVSDHLAFLLIIPDFSLKTEVAREALPTSYRREDVVYSLSRALLLEKGLREGDLGLLKEALKDRIATPYRKKLIPESDVFFAYADEKGLPITISGAGPSLLVLADRKEAEKISRELKALSFKHHWEVKTLHLPFKEGTHE